MNDLLFEIGTEEIPAGYINPALSNIAANLAKKLDEERIEHGKIETFGTPRRLSAIIYDVSEKQKALTTEILGPPAKIGFDENGKPTVAAEKFAEKAGVSIKEIKKKETPKGLYLSANIVKKAGASINVLQDILPQIILSVTFPKSMRWSDLKIEFARPIQYITALLGDKIISFSLSEKLKSDRYVWGHSFMSPQQISLSTASEYIQKLRDAYVFADISERKELVLKSVESAAKSVAGAYLPDEELLDIVTNLVEQPDAVCGGFNKKFLELPDEILITSMREHQKYFAVTDKDGKLMPYFIAVNNTITKDKKLAVKGHERVLRARLEDAMFFFKSDIAIDEEMRVEKLKGVLFQKKLGTMHDKTFRVMDIAGFLSDKTSGSEDKKEEALKAAKLLKSDLVSSVVMEFPKLQGVMGRVYAGRKNYAKAIEEHYMPTASGGALPETETGAIVAIADKIDSICGCFAANLIPTGASDPYSLRRQSIGILRIILDKGFDFSLKELINQSLSLFKDIKSVNIDGVFEKIYDFFQTRMETILIDKGLSKDIVAAVTSEAFDDISQMLPRANALEKFKKRDDFDSLSLTFKRVVNIIKKADENSIGQSIAEDLFEKEAEKKLFEAFNKVFIKVDENLQKLSYDAALENIASLKEPVDKFFDDVLVMADDEKIRANRLALLRQISMLFANFGDFTKIQG
jgi:glycyl-tRNA synthetase beta chain